MNQTANDTSSPNETNSKRPRFAGVFTRLRRHPIPIVATFRHSLVLTYALPQTVLTPLLPPGLVLDTFKEFGFVAIALVQTKSLRPKFFPEVLGQDFFLSGYRIFTRYKTTSGRTLRGLRILRSDTDKHLMVTAGNRLTHYNYRKAIIDCQNTENRLEIDVKTPNAEADLNVIAELAEKPAPLPHTSPFTDLHEARLFAGPLPFTFDYEPETHSIVMIEGVRRKWNPHPVKVTLGRNTFFQRPPFHQVTPLFANAFYVENIDYEWKRGVGERLPF